jgi:hypothetical protein
MTEMLSRRHMIQSLCGGLGSVGLSAILGQQTASAAALGRYAGPKLPAKAKQVIFLFMAGGPSQIDTFDPKPSLLEYQGQRPDSVNLRTERQTGGLLPSPFVFRKRGKSGVDVSELLPQLSTVIDDVCVIRSMYTFNPTHVPARSLIHSGSILANRPSLGAWISYGLGSENENLPSFVVLTPGGGGGSLWRAGFLPAEHQGVAFNDAEVEPEKMIANLRNQWLDPAAQRKQLDAVQALNREHAASFGQDAVSRGPHQVDGGGVSHAVRGDRRLRHPQGTGSDSRRVRHYAFRQRLPAGAASGRGGSPLYPCVLRRRAGVGRP